VRGAAKCERTLELPQNTDMGAPRPPQGRRKRRLGAMDTLRPFGALGGRSGGADRAVSFSNIFCLSAEGSGEEPHKMQRKRRGMRASGASARGALGRWMVEVGSRKGEYLTADTKTSAIRRYFCRRRRALLGAGRGGFEDLASILWSEANRKSARCTDPVRIEKRTRGPPASAK